MGIPLNKQASLRNTHQGDYKRVLCVCSAGALRSPTTAEVLREEYGYNTRAAGVYREWCVIPVTEDLIFWCDEIVCMEQEHADAIRHMDFWSEGDAPIIVLGIPDCHSFRSPDLIEQIKERYKICATPS
jgi:predicted protein tyrosine phosphatase